MSCSQSHITRSDIPPNGIAPPVTVSCVRSLDGPIGHGTLFATIARLERLTLIEPTTNDGDRRAYRLTQLGLAAAGSVAAIQGEAHA